MKGIYTQRHKPHISTGILDCGPVIDSPGQWACAARFNHDGFGYAHGETKHEAQVKAYAKAIHRARAH